MAKDINHKSYKENIIALNIEASKIKVKNVCTNYTIMVGGPSTSLILLAY